MIAVEPVYVWIACQKRAVAILTTMANRAKYQPKEDLATTGKGTWRRAPMIPLRTRGTVQQRLPKMMQMIASRLNHISESFVLKLIEHTKSTLLQGWKMAPSNFVH